MFNNSSLFNGLKQQLYQEEANATGYNRQDTISNRCNCHRLQERERTTIYKRYSSLPSDTGTYDKHLLLSNLEDLKQLMIN
jgi:hypothetical protein